MVEKTREDIMDNEYIDKELTKFNVADAAISQMSTEYMPLEINGVEDIKGFKIVHTALMAVKKKRVAVEKTRKELKADSLKFGRAVDAEAKRITALLAPIEDHLSKEKQAVIDEQARIKAEEERIEKERKAKELEDLKAKIRQEAEARAEAIRKEQEAAAKIEADRLAVIAKAQKEETDRLNAIAAEQKETARVQAAIRDANKAEADRLAALAAKLEVVVIPETTKEPAHAQDGAPVINTDYAKWDNTPSPGTSPSPAKPVLLGVDLAQEPEEEHAVVYSIVFRGFKSYSEAFALSKQHKGIEYEIFFDEKNAKAI